MKKTIILFLAVAAFTVAPVTNALACATCEGCKEKKAAAAKVQTTTAAATCDQAKATTSCAKSACNGKEKRVALLSPRAKK